MLNVLHEIPYTNETEPESFGAGFAVGFVPREAVERGDLSNALTYRGRLGRWYFLRQNVSALPLKIDEQSAALQFRVGMSRSHQSSQAPCYHHIHRKRQFQFCHAAQLQSRYMATILEHVEEDFDCRTAAIPLDQFNCPRKASCCPIGQQAPFHRLTAHGRLAFLGDVTGDGQHSALAVRNGHCARPHLLPHEACA